MPAEARPKIRCRKRSGVDFHGEDFERLAVAASRKNPAVLDIQPGLAGLLSAFICHASAEYTQSHALDGCECAGIRRRYTAQKLMHGEWVCRQSHSCIASLVA